MIQESMFLDQLRQKLAGTRAAYKADFLRVKDDVARCLAEGLTIRAIYDHLAKEKKISCTYETFRTYVRKHIQPRPKHDQARKRRKEQTGPRSGKRR